MQSGNIDEIAQRIIELGEYVIVATKRKTAAMTYHSVTSIEEMREVSRKFACGLFSHVHFDEELKRINVDSARHLLDAQAARENITYLNTRITQLTIARNAMIQIDTQTKRMLELQAEYKKSADLREQALKDKADALKVFTESEKMVEAKKEIPTLALFDSLCVSLGAPAGSAIAAEPKSKRCSKPSCGAILTAANIICKPDFNGGKSYCSITCASNSSPAICANSRCWQLVTHPITSIATPDRVFCSVNCARNK